jgi:proteasome lid subunit RPN8/RPN11
VGLVLAGPAGAEVVPLGNALPAREALAAFAVDPGEWMAVERRALEGGQRLAALYHSHPRGPLALSAEDLHFATPGGQPLAEGLQLWLVGPDSTGKFNQFRCFNFTEGGWSNASPCSFG